MRNTGDLLAGKDISPARFNLITVLSVCCLISCGFLYFLAFAVKWTNAVRLGMIVLASLVGFFSFLVLGIKSRYCTLLRMFRTNEISRLTLASAVDAEKVAAVSEVKDRRTIEKLKENQEQVIQKTAGQVAGQVSKNFGENVMKSIDRRFSEQELRMRDMFSRLEKMLEGAPSYQETPEENPYEEEEDYESSTYENYDEAAKEEGFGMEEAEEDSSAAVDLI